MQLPTPLALPLLGLLSPIASLFLLLFKKQKGNRRELQYKRANFMKRSEDDISRVLILLNKQDIHLFNEACL